MTNVLNNETGMHEKQCMHKRLTLKAVMMVRPSMQYYSRHHYQYVIPALQYCYTLHLFVILVGWSSRYAD